MTLWAQVQHKWWIYSWQDKQISSHLIPNNEKSSPVGSKAGPTVRQYIFSYTAEHIIFGTRSENIEEVSWELNFTLDASLPFFTINFSRTSWS